MLVKKYAICYVSICYDPQLEESEFWYIKSLYGLNISIWTYPHTMILTIFVFVKHASSHL